jgi:hypothetical protein
MKELLFDIITKIIYKGKVLSKKIKEGIDLEGRKSGVINVMYNPIFEKKIRERDVLLSELKGIEEEIKKLDSKINEASEEKALYETRINAISSFRKFLLDNPY